MAKKKPDQPVIKATDGCYFNLYGEKIIGLEKVLKADKAVKLISSNSRISKAIISLIGEYYESRDRDVEATLEFVDFLRSMTEEQLYEHYVSDDGGIYELIRIFACLKRNRQHPDKAIEKELIMLQEKSKKMSWLEINIVINGLLKKALQYEEDKKYELAIIEYEKILAMRYEDEIAPVNGAKCYYKLEQYDKAIEFAERRFDKYMQKYLIGMCYYNLKEYQKAQDYFLMETKFRRDNKDAHYMLGVCYGLTGNKQKQIDHYKIAAKLGDEKARQALI